MISFTGTETAILAAARVNLAASAVADNPKRVTLLRRSVAMTMEPTATGASIPASRMANGMRSLLSRKRGR